MRLHVSERGDGKPVCLMHGLFGRSQNLGAVARRLEPAYRVISVDLRNHGASEHRAGMSYAEMSGDVLETLQGIGALPCALLGHSMGGKVAMVAALTQPALVQGLIVADIAPVAYAHRNAEVAAAMQALPLTPGLDRRTADLALADSVPDPAVRGFLLQNLSFGERPAWKIGLDEIAAGMTAIEGWPAQFAASRYESGALFIRGGQSDYVSDASWPVIEAMFPRARLATVEGAAHWLHADQPEVFGGLVAGFLAGADAAGCGTLAGDVCSEG